MGGRGHPGPDEGPVDLVANGEHGADQVVARDEREIRLAGVAPSTHALLSEGDTGSLDPNQSLSCCRWCHRPVADLQPVGLHDSGQHYFGGDDGLGVGGSGGFGGMEVSHRDVLRSAGGRSVKLSCFCYRR